MEMNRRFLDRGGIFPRGCPQGRSQLRAECLIEGGDPSVEVTVRLLQAVERQVLDAEGEPVEFLAVAGKRYATRSESVEREVRISMLPDRTATVKTAGSKQAELVENGAQAGALVWHWESMHCTVEAWIEELEPGLSRVRVDVANRLEWDGGGRERTLMRTLHSTHVVMHSPDGAFVSLTDPPRHLRDQSANCHNDGLWPVVVGEAGDRRTMLASPARLEDYPQSGLDSRNPHPTPL
jgi:hydrogenase maturation protease